MTHIVAGYKTKKELKAVLDNILSNGSEVYLSDPSIFPGAKSIYINGFDGRLDTNLSDGEMVVCTNHPKRSWFAQVTRKGGKVVVR